MNKELFEQLKALAQFWGPQIDPFYLLGEPQAPLCPLSFLFFDFSSVHLV